MMSFAKQNWFYCLFILVSALLVYSGSFHNSFQYDDFHVIVKNPFIKDAGDVWRVFVDPHLGSGIIQETSGYRPLLLASFILNYSLGGLHVFGYHLFNVLLHGLCAVLVFYLTLILLQISYGLQTRPLRDDRWVAFFAGLIFALHPVQTESVTYITGRSSLMMAFFFLLAIWGYVKFRLTGKTLHIFLSSFSYACGLLVKETVITLPIILIVFNFLYPLETRWKKRLFSLLPHLFISVLYLIIRIYLLGSLEYAGKPIRPLYEQLLTQSRAWVQALGTLVLPLNLNVDYDFQISRSILQGPVLFSIFLLAATAVIVWVVSRRNRLVGFFALWFALTLAPTNSLIPLQDVITDRWLYLPSFGYAGIMALAAQWIYQVRVRASKRAVKLIFFFFLALIVELYGYATVLRNFTWTSYWTLWEDAVEKSPHKYRPHLALGLALTKVGRTEEAIAEIKKALQLNPKSGEAYLNLGFIYQSQGKQQEAIQAYQEAEAFSPRVAVEAHNNLAAAYLQLGLREQAIKESRLALAARPFNGRTYYNLGNIYEQDGDIDKAISCMEKAAKLEPEFIPVYQALARLYKKKGWEEKSRKAHENYLKYHDLGNRLFLGD
jgi:tetratricopeptide (TPR) repeat protein